MLSTRLLQSQGKGLTSSCFSRSLQLPHRYCENPDLVLGGHPGLMVILKRQHSSLMGTAGLGSPSAVGGRKCSSMCGMRSWHLLARVSRCQERRGQEVPSCMARVENSDAIPETTCTRTSAQASGPEPQSWLWTAMKIVGSWQYFRVKRSEGSSWLPPRHRQ